VAYVGGSPPQGSGQESTLKKVVIIPTLAAESRNRPIRSDRISQGLTVAIQPTGAEELVTMR
jgi:hypothetical protein